MRATDKTAIEKHGIPGIQLMERAGGGAWKAISCLLRRKTGPILIFAGKGNNGGDALVVARRALRQGFMASVVLMDDPSHLPPDAYAMFQQAQAVGVPILGWPEQSINLPSIIAERLEHAGLVVDGLLGTGLQGPPRGPYGQAIEAINDWRSRRSPEAGSVFTVSLDIPSGLDADRGIAFEPTIRADLTVSFHAAKLGLLMGPALEYVGRLWVVDIGIPPEAMPEVNAALSMPLDLSQRLPRIRLDSHKGRRGRLLIVAGSRGMIGAAILAARGALRAGAGLVTVASPSGERFAVASAVPEALTLPLPETGAGLIHREAIPLLQQELSSVHALVVGPGLGRGQDIRQLLSALLVQAEVPVVIDADGLNALAEEGLPLLHTEVGPRILTPHPGEAARLLGMRIAAVQSDRPAAARRLAKSSGAVAVLKGARTLVVEPSGQLWVNPTGSPALATGGTGDVLAGIIGALCAQSVPPVDAARIAVFVHGWAGQQLAGTYGDSGVVAGDLPEAVAQVMHQLRHLEPRDAAKLLKACGLVHLE